MKFIAFVSLVSYSAAVLCGQCQPGMVNCKPCDSAQKEEQNCSKTKIGKRRLGKHRPFVTTCTDRCGQTTVKLPNMPQPKPCGVGNPCQQHLAPLPVTRPVPIMLEPLLIPQAQPTCSKICKTPNCIPCNPPSVKIIQPIQQSDINWQSAQPAAVQVAPIDANIAEPKVVDTNTAPFMVSP
jgi:hypothetical protein